MEQYGSDMILICNTVAFPVTERTGKKINYPTNIEVYQTMYSKQPEKSQVFHFKGIGKLSSANARKLGTQIVRE